MLQNAKMQRIGFTLFKIVTQYLSPILSLIWNFDSFLRWISKHSIVIPLNRMEGGRAGGEVDDMDNINQNWQNEKCPLFPFNQYMWITLVLHRPHFMVASFIKVFFFTFNVLENNQFIILMIRMIYIFLFSDEYMRFWAFL